VATSRTADPPAAVLVADDDPSIRRLFTFLLEDAGIPVIAVADGEEALRVAGTRPLAAAVLDARMPRLDGVAVVAALRAQPATAGIPMLLVTGSMDADDRRRGFEAGVDDYLTKPVEAGELIRRVRAHLRLAEAGTLSDRLRARAALVDRLARHALTEPPAAAVGALCAELAADDPHSSFVLLALDDQAAQPVGSAGRALAPPPAGARMPHRLSVRLRRRLPAGAWVEEQRQQPAATVSVPLFDEHTRAAAYAAVPGPQGVVGLLAYTHPLATTEELLAAALEYAGIAGTLLGDLIARSAPPAGRRASLRTVVRERAFAPHFQPVVDLSDQRAVGHELLTRFDDGTTPAERFGEAAALGMSVEVEQATISAALDAAESLPAGTWLSINVSPTLLLADDTLAALLGRSERRLVIELTEQDRIDDYRAMREVVAGLGDEVSLSIDDAGAGLACLQHVVVLEPDFLKLDRRWIDGIAGDPARQALVAGLAHFAERWGITLVAEGVERSEEARALAELGVSLAQGFLLGRPALAPAEGS
jgi:EAL domain-containing protein (putative c-di-GMP-specific phosphodiesterase class I)/CheY-like chemotaxis protein